MLFILSLLAWLLLYSICRSTSPQTTIESKVLCVKEKSLERVVAIYVLLREYLSVE